MTVKSVTSNVTSNIVGALVGSVALFYGSKKLLKVENKYALVGLVLVGAVAGAMAQSKLKSRASIKPAISAAK